MTSKATVHNLHDWQESYQKSNLNWEVEKRPLFNKEGNEIPMHEIVRSDTKAYLGSGTDQYEIIQNKRLFQAGFDLTNDIPGIKFHSADYIKDGKCVIVKFKLPFKLDIGGVGDVIESYLVLSTYHGGGALSFGIQTLRLVCTNGMTAFRNRQITNVHHTSSAENKIAMNTQIIKGISLDFKVYGETLEALAKTPVSIPMVGKIVENVFNDGEDSNIYSSSVKQNKARAILNIFELNDNDTFKKQRNTAYALLQSFSNYADHNISYRPSGNESDVQARLRGTLFGVGEALKQRALQEIIQVVSESGVLLPKWE